MKTRRHHVRIDGDYRCRVFVEFADLDTSSNIEEPAEGLISITLSENVPHPVEIGIENIDDREADATHIELKSSSQTVTDPSEYPAVFRFITKPSQERGGKWYFCKTGKWVPNSDFEIKEDPEFIKHHTPGIPSAQRIRLVHRILEGDAGEETINDLTEFYQKNRTDAASEFSEDIKAYVGFEPRARIQNFLIGKTGLNRSASDTANKVAKQLIKEEYWHRVTSTEDIEQMVATINDLENFPQVTVNEVLNKMVKRCNKDELEEISDHLGVDDWSVVLH